MELQDFDYHLPPELVAQYPAGRRADSRMLVVYRKDGRFEDALFRDLPQFLQSGDVLALNNSRVVPARLFGRRSGVRAQPVGRGNPKRSEHLRSPIEILLVRQLDKQTWEALVRPGRKVQLGERLLFAARAPQARATARSREPVLEAEVIGRGEFGLRTLRFVEDKAVARALEKIGHVPLPPYIRREDEKSDRLRYQTVYARRPGSVAAPTAGLHFTKAMLGALGRRGVQRVEITLHVGLGTFQPVHGDALGAHRLHPETYEVGRQSARQLTRALKEGRRIVAVGTTTVRTLEHLAAENDGRIVAGTGETRLFILPGFQFRVVGGMLTNFHLPQSTLLMLVAAFVGRELVLEAYEHAVRERYRFYSYGDCMLLV